MLQYTMAGMRRKMPRRLASIQNNERVMGIGPTISSLARKRCTTQLHPHIAILWKFGYNCKYMKTVVLCILDGFGIGRKTQGNPMREVGTPTFDWIKSHFPYFGLQASGIAVGLPWGDVGSSEIGHLSLGTGRIVYQNYPKITMAVRDGRFAKNAVLAQALAHAKASGRLHLIGMVSSAKTHAALEHVGALLAAAHDAGIMHVFIHVVTDGQDALPQQGKETVAELARMCVHAGTGTIASVSGRHYAMDANAYWDRTERFVKLLIQGGRAAASVDTLFDVSYKRGITDAVIEPQMVGDAQSVPSQTLQEGDTVIFFNFREDGLAQTSRALCAQDFSSFVIKRPNDVAYVSMTQYGVLPDQNVMFPREAIANSLSQVLADRGMRQVKLMESMKEDLLAYHFNGLRREPFQNEHRIIVPSERKAGLAPVQLQGETVVTRLFEALDERIYDCIIVNFPQLDAAGHQTDYERGKQAVMYVDGLVNRIAKATLDADIPMIITSDHGNIEQMFDPATGVPDTRHNDNPVPCMLVGKQWYREKTESEILFGEREVRGSLADVAPTVLDLLSVPVPRDMTGQTLAKPFS